MPAKSRLSDLRREDLTEAQSRMWEAITAGPRGPSVVTPEGRLAGPFDVLLRSPLTGQRVSALGEQLRFSSLLEPRLLELTILIVASHWRAEFEWVAHAPLARAAGLDESVIDALRTSQPPAYKHRDEVVIARLASELLGTGTCSDETYEEARAVFDEPALVDIAAIVGYYTLLAFELNLFRAPVPEAGRPAWVGPGGHSRAPGA